MQLSYLVDLQQVSKIYQLADNQVTALQNITLQVMANESVAIVGSSGSGKSTLMNIIGLLDRQTSGQYFFANKPVDDLTDNELAQLRGQKIGFVFQSFFLLQRLSALENVMLPLMYQHFPRDLAKEKAYAMLSKLRMEQFASHLPSQLSGGQQQRVAIARALVGTPSVILADEPTGALDSVTGQEVMTILKELHYHATVTLIIITHDHAIAKQCQRIVTIKDGQFI